tara:strand:- start:971 stop:1078 length:108 start_codon:yes stop_codon:yes gene_type:complete
MVNKKQYTNYSLSLRRGYADDDIKKPPLGRVICER